MTLPIDRVIVQLLADLDNGSYCCWPTNRQIAAEVGCSIRTVHSSLKRLTELTRLQRKVLRLLGISDAYDF